MSKKITLCILACVVTLAISLFAFIPLNNVKLKQSTLWMTNLNDNTAITTMSIPGTHDSGAIYSIADVAGKCQDLSIKSQLNIGVRFFDIRLQNSNDKLKVVHSFVDQKLIFNEVLKDISAFIDKNPGEFVIISIKEDADAKNATKSFEELVTTQLEKYERIDYSNSLPEKLKDARGKIFILSRFNAPYGIQAYSGWKDSTTFEINGTYVQDNYAIDDIQVKIADVISAVEDCAVNPNTLHINFTSCYLNNAFPPSYAGTTANDINKWLLQYLKTYDGPVGIMLLDFITEDLTQEIYGRN